MNQKIFIAVCSMFLCCISSYAENVKANIFEIGVRKFEAAPTDLKNALNWYDARTECSKLKIDSKDGWVLPSKAELNEIYKNKDTIGGFGYYDYWTSSEYNHISAWGQSFKTGRELFDAKPSFVHARCIRAL